MSALPQEPQAVQRDHAWIEREYNQEKYPVILTAAQDVLQRKETNLARAVGQVIEAERGLIPVTAQRSFVAGGSDHTLPTAMGSFGVSGVTTNAIATSCSPDTDVVVELGAGWGRNLFLTYLSGAAQKTTQFFSLEFAETARQATSLLARLDHDLKISPVAFDYHAPDYGAIPTGDAPTTLVTVHSVEQIPTLKEEVITDFLARRPNTVGVHFEPIGWQLPSDRLQGITPRSSPAYAAQHDYSRNFWQVLSSLQDQGIIKVTDVMPDFIGQNPLNPATFIRWHST